MVVLLVEIGEVRSQKVRRAALKELLSRETYNSYCKGEVHGTKWLYR